MSRPRVESDGAGVLARRLDEGRDVVAAGLAGERRILVVIHGLNERSEFAK